jgi:hypothetical protein
LAVVEKLANDVRKLGAQRIKHFLDRRAFEGDACLAVGVLAHRLRDVDGYWHWGSFYD